MAPNLCQQGQAGHPILPALGLVLLQQQHTGNSWMNAAVKSLHVWRKYPLTSWSWGRQSVGAIAIKISLQTHKFWTWIGTALARKKSTALFLLWDRHAHKLAQYFKRSLIPHKKSNFFFFLLLTLSWSEFPVMPMKTCNPVGSKIPRITVHHCRESLTQFFGSPFLISNYIFRNNTELRKLWVSNNSVSKTCKVSNVLHFVMSSFPMLL